jgi:hypothetical protein
MARSVLESVLIVALDDVIVRHDNALGADEKAGTEADASGVFVVDAAQFPEGPRIIGKLHVVGPRLAGPPRPGLGLDADHAGQHLFDDITIGSEFPGQDRGRPVQGSLTLQKGLPDIGAHPAKRQAGQDQQAAFH